MSSLPSLLVVYKATWAQLCLFISLLLNLATVSKARISWSDGIPCIVCWLARNSANMAARCAACCPRTMRIGYCEIWYWLQYPLLMSRPLASMLGRELKLRRYVGPPLFSPFWRVIYLRCLNSAVFSLSVLFESILSLLESLLAVGRALPLLPYTGIGLCYEETGEVNWN